MLYIHEPYNCLHFIHGLLIMKLLSFGTLPFVRLTDCQYNSKTNWCFNTNWLPIDGPERMVNMCLTTYRANRRLVIMALIYLQFIDSNIWWFCNDTKTKLHQHKQIQHAHIYVIHPPPMNYIRYKQYCRIYKLCLKHCFLYQSSKYPNTN